MVLDSVNNLVTSEHRINYLHKNMIDLTEYLLLLKVGFITYNRSLQFYMIPEGASQASQLVVGRLDLTLLSR